MESLAGSPQNFARVVSLDAAGHLVAPGETGDSFMRRMALWRSNLDSLETSMATREGFELWPGLQLKNSDRIPKEILEEAASCTESLYGFKIDWVPGFFLSKGLGLLWGGCAISLSPPSGASLFLVRSAFAKKEKWFIYGRKELLAHELCHVAREALQDLAMEEHFAYQTSLSRFRRYIGNCFRSEIDAYLFVVPVFILLGVQLCNLLLEWSIPAWPFWLLALLPPAWLLTRNQLQRVRYFKAERALSALGCPFPKAVLFRCLSKEVDELSKLSGDALKARLKLKSETELRWAVIAARFLSGIT